MDFLRRDWDFTTGFEEEKGEGSVSKLFTNFEAHEENNKSVVPGGISAKYLENVIPTHLLMVSFLEHICSLYGTDENESSKLFQALCQQLVEMKLTPSFTTMNDFKAIRRKYQRALLEWLHITTGVASPKWTINPSMCNEFKGFSKVQPPLYGISKPHVLASRYSDEFEEYEQVGYGGFGSVFKVRNNLDGRIYAIKKVHLSEEDYKECQRVLREVKVLAQLAHPNIVRYYSAWLEYSRSFKSKYQNQEKHLHTSKEVNSALSRSSHNDSSCASDSSSILFQDSVTEDKMPRHFISYDGNMESSITFLSQRHTGQSTTGKSAFQSKRRSSLTHRCCEIIPFNGSRFSRSLSSDNVRSRSCHLELSYPSTGMPYAKTLDFDWSSLALKEFGITMFIQMEMCSSTLKDWLVDRNNSLAVGESVDWSINVHIIRQLLRGVRYIHKTGLIHRDLKPKNIFINPSKDTRQFDVKIGDFGLARSITDGLLHVASKPSTEKLFTSLNESLMPTSGVGTCTYAAPEQLNNSHYSLKADIYSLGIILFELFCPFRTEMERAMALKALRDGKVPKEVKAEWPTESELIESMIHEDPTLRPSANELLQHPLFFDKDVLIAMLRKELAKKDAEIAKLKDQINFMSLSKS